MKKDKLYLYNIITISFIVFTIGFFGTTFLIRQSIDELLKLQINTSKRESKEFSKLISFQIENNVNTKILINNIQKSIEESDKNSSFISMINWSGIEICNPDPKKIGGKLKSKSAFIKNTEKELNSKDLYNYLNSKENDSDNLSEVIYLYPVKNSDWIIVAHANVPVLQNKINRLKNYFFLIYTLGSLLISLLIFLVVRAIGSYYEKFFETKNETLIDEVLNLSKLNSNLTSQKDKIVKEDKKETTKKRILTYLRDQLISVDVNNIAYIYTENSITKIICIDGSSYTSNSNLEELYSNLNDLRFFRANRQYIIAITAIDKILQYGKNQLKIILKSETNDSIIISKNKASEFKKWLNR